MKIALDTHVRLEMPEPFFSCVRHIFTAVSLLRKTHKGHEPRLSFSPGDRLIGDTGEALAKLIFNLEPLRTGETKGHDYWSPDLMRKVQVKTTAMNNLSLLGRAQTPFEQLIAFKLYPDGTFEVLYNGPGAPVLNKVVSSSIAISTIRTLHDEIQWDCERVPFRDPLPELSNVDI